MAEATAADLDGNHQAEARGQPLKAAEAVESRQQAGAAPEEEEDEEEEPRLKYQRLGSSVTEILRQDAASCLSVSSKLLALGTHDGTIHVLDFAGNEVKRFEVHKSKVNDISIDAAVEFFASCSDDGSAAVHGLYTDESIRFKHNKPVKTVALDPRYGQRKTREFISGGVAGQLLLTSKGWLGNKDTVLHSGEGAISTARWCGNFVAWANERGVKIYDTSAHQILGFVPRPKASLGTDMVRCQLFWEQDQLLYIGWGDSVKAVRMRVPASKAAQNPGTNLVIEIVAAFKLEDCLIAGIAPFGEDIALLTYILEGEGSPRSPNGLRQDHAGEARRPELKIVDWQNVEKASDALSINGFEHYQAHDYALEACYLPSSSWHTHRINTSAPTRDFTKWWQDGDEPQYYLVSPKDIVVGRPRDGDDRIVWLVEHVRFEQALHVLETDKSLKSSSHQKVAQEYLEHLIKEGQFSKAASLCPRLLQKDATAWERWVYLFNQLRQLALLAPVMPTEDPQLRGSAYEMVLHAFLLSPSDHPHLLKLVQQWPSHLYSLPTLTQAVVQRIRTPGGDSEALLETAACLYQLQARYDLTLAILLRLRRERVFDFICSHHLMPLLKGHAVTQLLSIDSQRALSLLVDFHEEDPPSVVVPAIQAAEKEAEEKKDAKGKAMWRRHLHSYLNLLFLKGSDLGSAFHSLQVELYAEYEPQRLMTLLISSQSYGLEAAHELCKQRGLVREQVFVLGRMGNAQEALHLIVQQLADIPQAIEFVQMQQDDELWDLLIALALSQAPLTGALLDHIGSHINPLRLVSQIPEGMVIESLRDRLVTIVADFRSQTSLRTCCATLLRKDCLALAQRLYRSMQKALMPVQLYVNVSRQADKPEWLCCSKDSLSSTSADIREVPGPCGAKELHLLSPGSEQPNVWVGFANAVSDAEEVRSDPQRSQKRLQHEDDRTLPELVRLGRD